MLHFRFILTARNLTMKSTICRAAWKDKQQMQFITSTAGSLLMSHQIENFDVRCTILEFGRCFCSGSIAGGVLRNSHTLQLAISIRAALEKFASCSHCGGLNVNGETSRVCTDCITNLNFTESKIKPLL